MSIHVTLTGRAVAKSGLLPHTAFELLTFISKKSIDLQGLLIDCAESEGDNCDDFAFVMLLSAFGSQEYRKTSGARRFLPYQFLTLPLDGPQQRVKDLLLPGYTSDALNAANIAYRWIRGAEMKTLESIFDVRSGVLLGMFADASSILRGIADILFAATSTGSIKERPTNVDEAMVPSMRALVAAIRQLAIRLDAGLPDDVIWMRTLTIQKTNGPPAATRRNLLSRQQIINLRDASFNTPSDILDSGRFSGLLQALGVKSSVTRRLAEDLQDATRNWRVAERERLIERQKKRLPATCANLLLQFYAAREIEFEKVLDKIFNCFSITVSNRDDGKISGFPDFVVETSSGSILAIECKSKTVGEAVTFNDATDVIRKANVNGYRDAFKVTICQPYISPDVPRKINNCQELCVVNAEDLAEAFVKLKLEQINIDHIFDWLSRPGQALSENLVSSQVNMSLV